MKFFIFLSFFVSQIFAFNINFDHFSSDFAQTVKAKNSTLYYKGYFILSKDKALWSYETPAKKEIYIDKNQVTLVEHDLEQVIFSKLQNTPNLQKILQNAKKLDSNTFKARYEKIDYTVKIQNNTIKTISYKDEFDNDIIIDLSHQNNNAIIKNDTFKPKFPDYYDIVH